MPIQRIIVEDLAENYNDGERSFIIHGHVIPISTWDVYCILGLVDEGEKVDISSKKVDPNFFNLYKGRGEVAIILKHLEDRIGSGVADDLFCSMFMLYVLETVLAPCCKEYVSSRYYEIVSNVEKL
ncbi:hypothetical protein ABZP36_001659 [Zizania latifolia]